jgi:hypothetical protein
MGDYKTRIKGLDMRTLRSCRTFYNLYPQIRGTVSAEFQQIYFQKISSFQKNDQPIRETASPELQTESSEAYPVSSELLLTRLSFSHFLELIRVDDAMQRLFYEVEAIKNNWSVRELERTVLSGIFVR